MNKTLRKKYFPDNISLLNQAIVAAFSPSCFFDVFCEKKQPLYLPIKDRTEGKTGEFNSF